MGGSGNYTSRDSPCIEGRVVKQDGFTPQQRDSTIDFAVTRQNTEILATTNCVDPATRPEACR